MNMKISLAISATYKHACIYTPDTRPTPYSHMIHTHTHIRYLYIEHASIFNNIVTMLYSSLNIIVCIFIEFTTNHDLPPPPPTPYQVGDKLINSNTYLINRPRNGQNTLIIFH